MKKTAKPQVLGPDELSVFCYELSLMVQAGIGSEESVGILAQDARSPREKELLERMHAVLLEGRALSAALEETGVFPHYMLRMVEIGQASGRLDQVLSALSAYYRREADTQQSLRRAIAYPAAMAVLIAVVFLALVSRVLPVFQQVFSQLGVSLSPVARGLMTFGAVSKYVAAAFAVVLVAAAVWVFWMFRTAKGQAALSRLLSGTAPYRAVDRSRFASAMALMLSSGLPKDEAMDRSCDLLDGTGIAPALKDCRDRMAAGTAFADAVESCGLFTGLQAGLLSAGFRAGVSEQAMEELSRRCQADADERLSLLLSRFEYGLVIILCLAVGLVLLSVMLPLLGVLSAIGG